MKVKRYASDELSFIAHALTLGCQMGQLATFFGVTPAAITAVCDRHQLRPHKPSPPDINVLGRQFNLISAPRLEELRRQELIAPTIKENT